MKIAAAILIVVGIGAVIELLMHGNGTTDITNEDSRTPDKTVTASGTPENTTRVVTVILGESRLEEDVERASLIVRAEVLAVGDTDQLKAGLEQANVQFKITKVLKGKLETDVISVPIAVPSLGEAAKVRYPV